MYIWIFARAFAIILLNRILDPLYIQYNIILIAIGWRNETIYYGRAGNVLKKEKTQRPSHIARIVINPIMLLC